MKISKILKPLYPLAIVSAIAMPMIACKKPTIVDETVVKMVEIGPDAGKYQSASQHLVSSTRTIKFTNVKMVMSSKWITIHTQLPDSNGPVYLKSLLIEDHPIAIDYPEQVLWNIEGFGVHAEYLDVQVTYNIESEVKTASTTITLSDNV